MSNDSSQSVSRNRFEFKEDGETAYLEFDVEGHAWMTLWHTEVPPPLRGRGIAGTLAQTAFEYAREHHMKVDVICPLALDYVQKHPEFRDLIEK